MTKTKESSANCSITGFTFIRNAVKGDYPFIQSVESILPLCNEFVINAGDSEDDTNTIIENLVAKHPEIKWTIIYSKWDMSKRKGGIILSEQTNIALQECEKVSKNEWLFYIQADEVLHEDDLDEVKNSIAKCNDDKSINGLKLYWKHMAGSLITFEASKGCYNQEIRIIRNNRKIESWGDAQSFRMKDGSSLNTYQMNAEIYHYSHARAPDKMLDKIAVVGTWWHTDEELKQKQNEWQNKNPHKLENLIVDEKQPPKVMKQYIDEATWSLKHSDFLLKEIKSMMVIFPNGKTSKSICEKISANYPNVNVQFVEMSDLSFLDILMSKERYDFVLDLNSSLVSFTLSKLLSKHIAGLYDNEKLYMNYDVKINITNRDKKKISKPLLPGQAELRAIARIGCI